MNIIKFCSIAPLLILIPTESLPVAQPPITPSHVLHIRKDLPGIISFGPIFISSVKRGIFTDHVSIHSCNGCPYGSNGSPHDLPLLDCKEKPDTPEIVEVEEPLEVISVQEDKPVEEDDEINDLVSDYNDFLNKSTLTSEQIYLIQMLELNKIKEKELNQGLEVLNQVKEIPNELEPEDIGTPFEEPSFVQSNNYEHIEHSNIPQKPIIEPGIQENQSETQEYENNSSEPGFEAEKPEENPSETQEFENDSTVPQELSSEPNEFMKPVESISNPLKPTPEEIQKEVQEPENVEENSTEANIWSGPTSPEVAQSVNEYIEDHKPGEIYPCPPKDSTQISERHDNLIKSSLTGVSKRIKNYFNGVRAYAARHDDPTGFM